MMLMHMHYQQKIQLARLKSASNAVEEEFEAQLDETLALKKKLRQAKSRLQDIDDDILRLTNSDRQTLHCILDRMVGERNAAEKKNEAQRKEIDSIVAEAQHLEEEEMRTHDEKVMSTCRDYPSVVVDSHLTDHHLNFFCVFQGGAEQAVLKLKHDIVSMKAIQTEELKAAWVTLESKAKILADRKHAAKERSRRVSKSYAWTHFVTASLSCLAGCD